MARAARWLPLVSIIALLGAAMIAAAYSNPTITRVGNGRGAVVTAPPEAETAQPPTPESAAPTLPPEAGFVLPGWVARLATALCAAFVLALLAALLWMLVRDRLSERRATLTAEPGAGQAPTPQAQIRAAVQEVLADLDDADVDPRRAVIACWVRLEESAAEAGTPREPGDTSTDLVRRLLATHDVSATVLDGLAAVYREARYATHVVDAAMRDEARSALRQLRDELSVGAR